MGMLDEKVAIITGATSGIGRRTAQLIVEEGARVVFTGRRQQEGETLAHELGGKSRFIAADATLEEDWQRVVAQTLAAYGRIDALFNNAGGPAPTGSITSIPVDGFDRAMALLVRSVMLGMKHVAPTMMQQRSGSIVNNGSIAAHLAGYSSSMVYSAAKAAVKQLSKCAAMELGEYCVRVNSVSPGAIATGIVPKALGVEIGQADRLADRMREISAKVQPIPRAGLPEDIAQCVAWLVSDRSSFVNGIDIVVDGGMIGGRMYSPHQKGLRALQASFRTQ
ncbi:MAG: SDR family oxidoreductase [Hyphomicrobiaceae bacterium]|nr:SDR family oxidoreductase [Hyphomicrobiaceae bacterium]